jgi:hypothetical protein
MLWRSGVNNKEAVQQLERDRRDREEIHGSDRFRDGTSAASARSNLLNQDPQKKC